MSFGDQIIITKIGRKLKDSIYFKYIYKIDFALNDKYPTNINKDSYLYSDYEHFKEGSKTTSFNEAKDMVLFLSLRK